MKKNKQLKKYFTNIKICLIFVIILTLITCCSIWDCDNGDNKTFLFSSNYKFAYKQDDTLMFVSTKKDTFYYQVSIKHGMDTIYESSSENCDEYFRAYENYTYKIRTIVELNLNTIDLDSTFIKINASIDSTELSYYMPATQSLFNYFSFQKNNTITFNINNSNYTLIAYFNDGNLAIKYNTYFHEYYGFLGFVVNGKDSLLLMDAPFYNEIIENKIIKKQ